jgi:hypothetical protein
MIGTIRVLVLRAALRRPLMRMYSIGLLIAAVMASGLASAQNQQSEADKGIKTRNSGESGYVGEQDKPGNSATPPGRPESGSGSTGAANSPSSQNSGSGIQGAGGSESGPAPGQANSQNLPVQEQDPAKIKGLPGNKSGPPAKR